MRVLKPIIAIAAVLVIMLAGLYAFRLPLAGWAVRSAMASAGLERPQARVTALSLNSARLEAVTAGPERAPHILIEHVDVDFEVGRLWRERRVKSVFAGPGSVRVIVDEAGKARLAGLEPKQGRSGARSPFDALILRDIDLVIDSPGGQATGAVAVDYNIDEGGDIDWALNAEALRFGANEFTRAETVGAAILTEDGAFSFTARFNGDVKSAPVAAREISATIGAEGEGWRDALNGDRDALALTGAVRLAHLKLLTDENPILLRVENSVTSAILGERARALTITGDIGFELQGGAFSLFLSEAAPLSVIADSGPRAQFTPVSDTAMFLNAEGKRRGGMAFSLSSARAAANGRLDYRREQDGWLIAAPITVTALEADIIAGDPGEMRLDGVYNAGRFDGKFSAQGRLKHLAIGRLHLADLPVDETFGLALDAPRQVLTLSAPPDCIEFDRARATLEGQDTELRLRDGEICETDETPLLLIDWSQALVARFNGALSAKNGFYRLAKTAFDGAPPRVSFSGVYTPSVNRTEITGPVAGGAMTLNDLLKLSAASGAYRFLLDGEAMSVAADLDRVVVAQNQHPAFVAPVIAAASVEMANDRARFDYTIETPRGDRLGAGIGAHDLKRGSGESDFIFERLRLDDRSLQPDVLAPVLKGIIGKTTGAADGVVKFRWNADGVKTSAGFNFDNIAFGGPTRVVTKTYGVNGAVNFAELWPIKSDGVQTITVDGVDLDALQLGKGALQFEFPGDDTLRIVEATFPWFGGTLGIYDAEAAMNGAAATIPMRVDNVDLAQIFEYVDVDGLSGEGILTGVLPLDIKDGKATIVDGRLTSVGAGAIRYTGKASEQALEAGGQARTAFELLRDLQFDSLGVELNGPLDGRLDFQVLFEGNGALTLNRQNVRVPVIYRVSLDAALLELLRQANLLRSFQLQIERGLLSESEAQ